MTAEAAPAAAQRFFAWEKHMCVSHLFLWRLPTAVDLAVGTC